MVLPADADIPLILSRLTPNAEWGFTGEDRSDLSNLVWRDQVQTEPAESEMETEWTAILADIASSGADQATLDKLKVALDTARSQRIIRAVLLVILDEINVLRTLPAVSLAARTKSQVRTAIQNKLDNIDSNSLAT